MSIEVRSAPLYFDASSETRSNNSPMSRTASGVIFTHAEFSIKETEMLGTKLLPLVRADVGVVTETDFLMFASALFHFLRKNMIFSIFQKFEKFLKGRRSRDAAAISPVYVPYGCPPSCQVSS